VFAACVLVVTAVLAQVALGRVVSSPWWMPDAILLTLAALVLVRPERALVPIALGAVLVLPVAGQHAAGVAGLYAAGALLLWRLTASWELAPAWAGMAAVALIEAMFIAWWLLLDGFGRLTLLGPAAWRVAVTALCLPVARAVVARLVR
jgi:hypothetical protein